MGAGLKEQLEDRLSSASSGCAGESVEEGVIFKTLKILRGKILTETEGAEGTRATPWRSSITSLLYMAASWVCLQFALLQASCPSTHVREGLKYYEHDTHIFVEIKYTSVEWKIRQEEVASKGNG
jgi:hypothetical protein